MTAGKLITLDEARAALGRLYEQHRIVEDAHRRSGRDVFHHLDRTNGAGGWAAWRARKVAAKEISEVLTLTPILAPYLPVAFVQRRKMERGARDLLSRLAKVRGANDPEWGVIRDAAEQLTRRQ